MRYQAPVVKLSRQERGRLEARLRTGQSAARQQTRARILLQADTRQRGSAWHERHIAEALGCGDDLGGRVRQQDVNAGWEAARKRQSRLTPPVPPIFDGEPAAQLRRLACSPPPAGQAGWSWRWLAHKLVELKMGDRASDNTIGRVLKKIGSRHTFKRKGLSRPASTARW
jgi:hypothetical protein